MFIGIAWLGWGLIFFGSIQILHVVFVGLVVMLIKEFWLNRTEMSLRKYLRFCFGMLIGILLYYGSLELSVALFKAGILK